MVWNPPRKVVFLSAAATCVGLACLVKDYTGGKIYDRDVCADEKIVIVTGANTGIGKQTAFELARRGAHVVMACRDLKKCEDAREEIVMDTRNKYVYCRVCDLASQKSVRDFVNRFNKGCSDYVHTSGGLVVDIDGDLQLVQGICPGSSSGKATAHKAGDLGSNPGPEHDRLDILINNAGVMRCPYTKTKEGIELQLGVNHMGHFLLTNLLLNKLKESAPSRIINVSSVAHHRGQINKEDLNSENHYDGGTAYNQSKLANLLFTKELAKRLQGTSVTVNAVHPGIVDTEIIRHMGFFNSTFSAIFLKPLVWMFVKSPRQGAQTIVYAALDRSIKNVTGKYFVNCAEEKVAAQAEDESTALWLWAVSEKWTKLNEIES